MTAIPTLRTASLSRSVNEKTIVEDVSVSLERGETHAVVGTSGAGKSSFLRLLNRLDEPTQGSVFLEGRDYREIPPRELRRRVGIVMQHSFLLSGTVADNICFGPMQRGESISLEEVEEVLGRVGLSGYGERSVNELSGGESQRVSFARTLTNSPEVLLLDEPTSALDEASRNSVEEVIRSVLRESRLTCVFVTHDLKQAARVADRVMVMEDGRLIRRGTVEEVLDA